MNKVLKYPGSKWNIAEDICALIPKHHSYVEPFLGSGAVLFSKSPSNIETINDLNSEVTNLFRCIQEDSEKLAKLVLTTPYSREEYEKQFGQNYSDEPWHRALSFLIRCWQSHGFRANEYKVGWKRDIQGRESMYELWNWYRLPKWIVDIAERLRCVQIENRPAIEVIRNYNYENVFMYLDPPYLLSARHGKQYIHEMTEDDHVELLQTILDNKAKIMISGYKSDLYEQYLSKWNKVELKSCAAYSGERTGVLWMNYEIGRQMSLFQEFPEMIR